MKIAIVTSGRFHVCDLARELSRLGHQVKFYSIVPPWRTIEFGLPRECNRWLLPHVFWAALKLRLASNSASRQKAEVALSVALDRAACRMIEPCEVVVGMSGLCNKLAPFAKKKYGAAIWIERGSRHILSQKEIMESLGSGNRVLNAVIERELVDYGNADRISLLSEHCKESFLEHGISESRVFVNPLGVDLNHFSATQVPSGPPTAIMTGTWCMRKGCDLLVKAWRNTQGIRLVHVGPVTDCPLPNDRDFQHFDRVNQTELSRFYSNAHVFVLASYEEGLATVQPQALACGLRLVCTDRTGGADLRRFVSDSEVIQVVPHGDAQALTMALQTSMQKATAESGLRDRLTLDAKDELSWQGYAKRYEKALKKQMDMPSY